MLAMGRYMDIVDDMWRCELEFSRSKDTDLSSTGDSDPDLLETKRRLPTSNHRHIRETRLDVLLILLFFSLGLLAIRQYINPALVDQFVSTAIALGSVSMVISFLFSVTGIRKETARAMLRRKKHWHEANEGNTHISSSIQFAISSAVQDVFILSCFLMSTIPFIVPWFLAYFFPFEFLCFAVIFTSVLEVLSQFIKLYQAPREGKGSARHLLKRMSSMKSEDSFKEEDAEVRDKFLVEFLLSESGREWCGAFILLESGFVFFASLMSFVWETFLSWSLDLAHGHVDVAGLGWGIHFAIVLGGVVSTTTFLQAFWLTYAAGGRSLHFANHWRFFQPLRGGSTFIQLQLIAWTLYGICLSLSAARLAPVLTGALTYGLGFESDSASVRVTSALLPAIGSAAHAFHLHRMPPGTIGMLYMMAQIAMVTSLSQYKRVERDHGLVRKIVETKQHGICVQSLVTEREAKEGWLLAEIRDKMRAAVLTAIIFAGLRPELTIGLISVASVHAFQNSSRALAFVCTLSAIYLRTYAGQPSVTGSRRLERGSFIFRIFEDYFNLSMVRTTPEPWDSRQEYICGYHPHGQIPLGATYMKMTSQWAKILPEILPFTLSATITHQIPVTRDVGQLSGTLEVSKKGFWTGLNRYRSVLLVPGGQHEMVLAPTKQTDGHVEPISTKHKGFVRIAFRRAARVAAENRKVYITPIFAFGDRRAIWNLPGIPKSIQRWFVSRLRTNVAFFPVGRWNLPCIPDKVPVMGVLGDPIEVPVLKGGPNSTPTDAQVNLLHRYYYSRLKDLFDSYKTLYGNGYENMEMIFSPPLKTITKPDFAKKWETLAADFEVEDPEDAEEFERSIDETIYEWPWREQIVVVFLVVFFMLGPIWAFDIASTVQISSNLTTLNAI